MPRSKKSSWLSRKEYKELKQRQSKSASSCELLSIPNDVLWSILGEWISSYDVNVLDSSYCNRKLRSAFLSLISSLQFYLHSGSISTNSSAWGWLQRRSIPCSHFVVQRISDGDSEATAKYVSCQLVRATSLQFVNIELKKENALNILSTALNSCGQLKELLFRNCCIDQLNCIDVAWQELESLSFINSSYLPGNLKLCDFGGSRLQHIKLDRFRELAFWNKETSIRRETRSSNCIVTLLAKHAPTLTSLTIENCVAVSSEAQRIAETCGANLCHLRILQNDFHVIHFARVCRRLVSLELLYCYGTVTDEALILFSQACSTLRRCILDNSYGFHDDAIIALAGNCPIELLSLNRAHFISDVAIIEVAEHCSNTLKEIHLDGCKRLTDASVLLLLDRCAGQLNTITFKGCHLLSDLCHISVSMMKS